MIQHFRKMYIIFSTIALFVVIMTIVGSISAVTYFRAHQEVETVLTVLSNNEGQMPSSRRPPKQLQNFSQRNLTQESMQQYRFFSSTVANDGTILDIDGAHISTVSTEQIRKLTQRVLRRGRTRGQVFYRQNSYAYRVNNRGNKKIVVFLDASLMTAKAWEVINLGLILGAISLVLYAIVLALFSKAAIRPIIQAEKRQKEFITNAGHELKTPLTVISANTEMQEMMNGEDDLTKSTKQQVSRLTALINHFVSLARLQERPRMTLEVINASEVTNRVADSFKAMIAQNGKSFKKSVVSGIHIKADEHYFYELISILLDNANKYCDPNGDIFLNLKLGRRKRNVILSVTNSFAKGENVDYNRFFERFYREDKARTISTESGYGIGLSMAQNIVKNFGGHIKADYSNGKISFIITLKRVNNRNK